MVPNDRDGDLGRREFLKLTGAGAAALGGVLVGSGQSKAADDSSSRAVNAAAALARRTPGAKLRILEPSGSLGNVKPVAEQWTKDTGIPIEYIETPLLEINKKVLQEAVAKSGAFDIALPATFGIPDLAESGVLVDLTDYAKHYNPDREARGCQALYNVGDFYKGRLYGLETDGDTYMMFYRKDYLESKEEQKRFADKFGYALKVAETWKELDDQAQFFYRPDKNFYGGALFRTRGFIAWEWNIRYHAKGQYLFDDNLNPLINTDAGVKALEELSAITKYLDPGARTNGLFENFEAYGSGRSFANIGWGGSQKFFWDPQKSKVFGKLAWGLAPGGMVKGKLLRTPYFNWGWNYVVSKYSPVQEIAYLFCQYAFSPKMSTIAVRDRGGYFDPFRECHYSDPVIRQTYGDGFLKVHHESMRLNFPDLYLKGQGEYWDVLDQNLQAADVGQKRPKEALDDTAKGWDRITQRMNKESQIVQWKFLKSEYPAEMRAVLA
jgi:multiple sugar transport system substrate-binding protein